METILVTYTDLTQPLRRDAFTQKNSEHARNLFIHNCTLDPCISSFTTITSLAITQCELGSIARAKPTQGIFPLLRCVKLDACSIPANCVTWRDVFALFPDTLHSISLANAKGNSATVDYARFTSLTSLWIANTTFHSNPTALPSTLTRLSLTNCYLRATCFAPIATLPSLEILALDRNPLTTLTTNTGVASLADLAPLTTLTSLSLASCTIKEWCGVNLSYALRTMTRLTTLYLRDNVGLRSTGLTFVLNALSAADLRTLDIEPKFFDRFAAIRFDFSVWKHLTPASREWLEDHCKKRSNCVEKTAATIVCHECFTTRDKHDRTCRECAPSKPCAARAAMVCTHVTTCDICYTPYDATSQIIEIACHHFFCKSCLFEWTRANTTCPTCRAKIIVE